MMTIIAEVETTPIVGLYCESDFWVQTLVTKGAFPGHKDEMRS
jgi:hypothetical protein